MFPRLGFPGWTEIFWKLKLKFLAWSLIQTTWISIQYRTSSNLPVVYLCTDHWIRTAPSVQPCTLSQWFTEVIHTIPLTLKTSSRQKKNADDDFDSSVSVGAQAIPPSQLLGKFFTLNTKTSYGWLWLSAAKTMVYSWTWRIRGSRVTLYNLALG